jgi:DHA1 family inner membrane transport protein
VAFFRNDTVNWLNLHYAVHSLALSGGEAFLASFLLSAGVPAPSVLAAVASIFAVRFLIRALVLPLSRRFGLRAVVIAGTLVSAAQYPVLAVVHGVGPALAILCLIAAVGDSLYWTGYHAYFAALGDSEHRGHQVGAREAAAAVFAIVGPLATGWALTTLGPRVAFGVTALAMAAGALPLLRTRDVEIARSAPGAFRAALDGVKIYAADGWAAGGFYYVWQIALFQSLGERFAAYGGAMALAAVAGAASGLALGRWIDRGHGPRAVWLAMGAIAAAIVLRALGAGHPVLAVIANAVGAVAVALYVPTVSTAVYNQAKAAPCVLRFHLAAEGGFDLGCVGGCLTAAAVLWARLPIALAILPALLGITVMTALLRRSYGLVGDPGSRHHATVAASPASSGVDGRQPSDV